MKAFIIVVALLLIPSAVYAYRMPAYQISDADWKMPAEDVFARLDARMHEIDGVASIARLENKRRNHGTNLSRAERRVYKEYHELKIQHQFWKYVVDLKRDLVKMAGPRADGEADLMAKKIIQKIYDLSREYKVAGSALINNLLINMKAKDKGFCYQYTDELRKMLNKQKWRRFDFHWGAAYDKTWLENNALVITAKGKPFNTGIVVDAWRAASKPYWNTVKDDRYPWVELNDVEIAEEKSTLPTPAK